MAKKPKDIEAIYNAALQKGSEAQRSAYLDSVCGDDHALHARVEALLKAHEQVGDFLEVPAVDPNATLGESPSIEGPGTRIGRYEVLELIGEGGMGLIYLAEQKEPVKRRVALKIVKLGMDTKQVVARFEAERQALALLDHPNIAHVFDAGTAKPGRPYFVMEYVKGMSITKYSDEHRLNIEQRLRLFEQVCEGVHHAHQKGIIHRDIKPSNILVSIHGDKAVPKIIDFGIAKAITQPLTDKTFFTHQGQLLGTPEYMSPEQVDLATQDIDTRSDIYSLGVVLYELLAGVLPFEKKSFEHAGFAEIQQTIRELEPASPSIRLTSLGEKAKTIASSRCTQVIALARRLHRELEWIPLKAMRKDRCRRYRSASEMADDIHNYLTGRPLIAGPETATYRVKKFVRKHAGSVATVALVAVTIVLGLVVSTAMYFRAERALEQEAAARSEAQAVIDFLTDDLLAAVYPEKAKSPEVTVRYVLQAASENLEAKFAGKPLIEAAIREKLGITYEKLGDFKAAEAYFERVLQIRREQLGEEDSATLASLSQLGWLYMLQARYQDAEPLLVKALETRRLVLGEEHPDTLDSMTKLAWQYLFRGVEGRFDEAKMLFEKVLEIGPRVLGEEHPVMLEAMCGRALRYIVVYEFNKAEPLTLKGFEISRRVLGGEHEVTLRLMNQLAWVYVEQGRLDEAEPLAFKVLEISQRVFGEDHPTTAQSMNNLGWLYTQQGRYDEAAELLTKSVEVSRRVLGEEHLFTLFFTNRLAELYGERDQYDEMDTLVVKALEISRRMLGEEHMQTWILKDKLTQRTSQLGSLGLKQYHAGEYEDALATFTRLEELRRALNSRSRPSDTAFIAMALYHIGRNQEAKTAIDRLRRMYDDHKHAQEEEYLFEAEKLFTGKIGIVYQAWDLIQDGELKEASELVEEFRSVSHQKDPVIAECVQSIINGLARAYDRLAWSLATSHVDEVRDGARAIESAAKACELTNWDNAPYVNTLAAAYAEAGDYKSAIKWQKKAIELLTEDERSVIKANYESRLRLYQSGKPYHTDVVGWWKFDEGRGSTVLDSSGHGNHGTMEGNPKWVAGIIDGALELNGDDFVSVDGVVDDITSTDITLSIWIKTRQGSEGEVFASNDSASAHPFMFGIQGGNPYVNDGGDIQFPPSINDGQWHFLVYVRSWSTGYVYVDGAQRGMYSAGFDLGLITRWSIGQEWDNATPSNFYVGTVDDARIYNYPLSPAEIKMMIPQFRKAHEPDPPNGVRFVDADTQLSWTSGTSAALHLMYLGDDFEDVSSADTSSPEHKGRMTETNWTPSQGELEPSKTYYWRIDEVEEDGTTVHTGNVWSFTTVPVPACDPDPADKSKYIDPNVELNWIGGFGAVYHDIYFGQDKTNVSSGSADTFKGNQQNTTYYPGILEPDTMYYWRIDEVEADVITKHKGNVWSFTTMPEIPISEPKLLTCWTFDEGSGSIVLDWSGHSHHGTIMGKAKWVSGKIGSALQFGGNGDCVVDPDAGEYLNGLAALTVCVWIKSNVTDTDKGFIIFEDPDTHDNRDMRYDAAGAYGGGTNLIKCGITSDADEGPEGWPGRQQLESSSSIQTTNWQHLAMTWSSGNRVALYINGKLDTPTWVEPGLVGALVGYTKLIIGKGVKDVSWNGLIDDVRIYSYALSEAEIRALHAGDEPRTTEK